MTRLIVAAGLIGWVGITLLLSQWRRLSRPRLTDRLRPFHPGAGGIEAGPGALSVDSLADVLLPALQVAGDRVSAVFGVHEALEIRLRRIHAPMGTTEFRLRQVCWSGAGLLVGLLAAAAGLPLAAAVLALAAGPLLAFLLLEQRLISASKRWQEALARELPVVGEQLAMLLNAGFSVGAALSRVSQRGEGCCAQDLRVVVNRIRQGVTESAALREWAEVARVDALDRLVSILALNSEASDLGRLVSAETRQARRDLQRTMTGVIERRGQQVWIPVTVATLVPGAILLAIPFTAALRLFSSA
jgi:tight adherence protein C